MAYRREFQLCLFWLESSIFNKDEDLFVSGEAMNPFFNNQFLNQSDSKTIFLTVFLGRELIVSLCDSNCES